MNFEIDSVDQDVMKYFTTGSLAFLYLESLIPHITEK